LYSKNVLILSFLTELQIMKLSIKTACYLALGAFSLFSFPLHAADIAAGAKKAAACTGCHGAKGISSSSQYPHLAGQQAMYLESQLNAFKGGKRANPIMQGMAANLTDADMENLAAFFASLPNKTVGNAKASPDARSKFAMCAGCHGANAEGRGGFPRLANQNADYLSAQLQAFKKSTRQGGPMPAIAASLSDGDIKVLSDYLSSLKPAK
jgi:cytochrome c553